jgi:murein DD-endopeptidase MepM/ murein hydrolase activator NlpD
MHLNMNIIRSCAAFSLLLLYACSLPPKKALSEPADTVQTESFSSLDYAHTESPNDTLHQDSICTMVSQDSASSAQEIMSDPEAMESEFQDEIERLYSSDSIYIDTTNWCTDKINAWRFDYKSMSDTVKILLSDTTLKRRYVHPFNGFVTSPFGPRGYFWHFGTDIKLQRGDTVRCAFDGIVRVIQNDRYGYGRAVVVRHFDGLETIYGHLSRTDLTPNTRIRAGEIIGLGGNTGRSTGSHLHFEIRYGGEPIDPGYIIDFDTYTLKCDTLTLSRDNFEYLTEVRKTVYHKIRQGETLSHIARRYGTTVRKLCSLNGITGKTILRVGRKIIVRKDTQT